MHFDGYTHLCVACGENRRQSGGNGWQQQRQLAMVDSFGTDSHYPTAHAAPGDAATSLYKAATGARALPTLRAFVTPTYLHTAHLPTTIASNILRSCTPRLRRAHTHTHTPTLPAARTAFALSPLRSSHGRLVLHTHSLRLTTSPAACTHPPHTPA